MSNWPSVLARLDADGPAPPVPNLPSSNNTAHAYHRATPSETDTAKHMVSALVVPLGPQVRDPVDLAVEKLVALGFDARKSKKALADTDTGNSISFDDALDALVRERKRDVGGWMHAGYRGRADERVGVWERMREEEREHERLMGLGMEGTLGGYEGGVGLGIGGVSSNL